MDYIIVSEMLADLVAETQYVPENIRIDYKTMFDQQNKPLAFWQRLREDYERVACLTHRASQAFRCILVLSLMANGLSLAATYYLSMIGKSFLKDEIAWKLMIAASISVVIRVYLTIFSLSGMHKESKAGWSYLYSVPSATYNIEKVASVIWQLERKAAYLVAAAGPVTSAWRDAQNGSKLVPLNSTPVILPPWVKPQTMQMRQATTFHGNV